MLLQKWHADLDDVTHCPLAEQKKCSEQQKLMLFCKLPWTLLE